VGADDQSGWLAAAVASVEGDVADYPAWRASPWHVVPLMERGLSRREIVRAALSTDNTASRDMGGNDEGYRDALCG
jgi:hypothetical protein